MTKPHITKETVDKAIREAQKMGDKYAGIAQRTGKTSITTDNNKANLKAYLQRHAKSKEHEYAVKMVTAPKKKVKGK